MSNPNQSSGYRSDAHARIGILLLNLGTPDAPTPAALRRYLKEFLSDRRVIEIPRGLWWPLLHGVILNLRPRQSARKYASIWSKQGSPLLVETLAQRDALAEALANRGHTDVTVACAMRYGKPSIAMALNELRAQHVDRLLVVPLYPQYSAASTASALDGVFAQLMRERNMPALCTVRDFHDHPAYIAALARQISTDWEVNGRPDVLVMSFHGMPRFTLERGDPYFHQCQKTAHLLAEALQLAPEAWRISFQSRFGRAEWLKPYTVEVVRELAQGGTRRIDVACPGFVADCLETLEEIAIEVREEFERHGGVYRYLPCLNHSSDWIEALVEIVAPHLAGWTKADVHTIKAPSPPPTTD
ncbi:ferrochelatase [Paludibacterium purpuratum]|uniref:Ferrochelatase n=1 Tax=Paludibacterium purpuratum TaxID=1144873 RepID=A0A4R7B2C3_9NEIS|nr:ferrochelatase [Paludibacterium purpuratum]TDR73936.1 ferrochelatase [Paludibacterium purpuratum]